MNIKEIITRPNPVIIEIGANVGSDTTRFAEEFPDATIHCFEPDPYVYNQLAGNVRKFSNVIAHPFAIGCEMTYASFYQSNQGLSGSLRKPKEHLSIYPYVSFLDPIAVRVVTLDWFVELNKIDFVDFVWADVQGAEMDMISGGINTFKNKVKYLLTEFSKVELYEGAPTLDTILETLADFELVEIVFEWAADGNALLRNKNL